MQTNGITQNDAIQQRQKYVLAWNTTMLDIWREQITLVDAIDTGTLLRSLVALPVHADDRFFDISISHLFAEHGLWVNYGTGRETPRKGSAHESRFRNADGTLINDKVRQRKIWFSKKYYASVMTLKEFFADSLGREFIGVISDVFNDSNLRSSHG